MPEQGPSLVIRLVTVPIVTIHPARFLKCVKSLSHGLRLNRSEVMIINLFLILATMTGPTSKAIATQGKSRSPCSHSLRRIMLNYRGREGGVCVFISLPTVPRQTLQMW